MFTGTGGKAVGVFSSAVSSVFEGKGLYEGYHITELLSRGINFLKSVNLIKKLKKFLLPVC